MEMRTYFQEKIPTVTALRDEIRNKLGNLPSTWPWPDKYSRKITKITDNLDGIIEIYENPQASSKYHLSLWREKKDEIQLHIRNIMDVARNL